MKSTLPRFAGILVVFSALMAATAPMARAQITFSIDTFTTDQLTITLNASTLTGSFAGSSPAYFTLIGEIDGVFGSSHLPTGSWISSGDIITGSETEAGAIGAVSFTSANASPMSPAGPIVGISGASSFVTGTSINSPYQVTFSEVGRFDTSEVTGFRLYWGNYGSSDAVFQSVTSLSAVPEPGSFAGLLGLAALGGVMTRRRRRA